MNRTAALLIGAMGLMVLSCGRRDVSQPPEVHFGEDVCTACGMIISDERYAAALWVVDEYGEYTPMRFDDIGEMAQWERGHPAAEIAARFVGLVDADNWSSAGEAIYVQSSELHTPMAYGIVAFASSDLAQARANSVKGAVLTYEEVLQAAAPQAQ